MSGHEIPLRKALADLASRPVEEQAEALAAAFGKSALGLAILKADPGECGHRSFPGYVCRRPHGHAGHHWVAPA